MLRLYLSFILLSTALLSGQGSRLDSRSVASNEEVGVSIPMRDGVHLAADIFLPQGSRHARLPAVLIRTPYNRKLPSMFAYRYFAANGFAVVIEDVRGRYASQGSFGMVSQEGQDGNDTINWVAEQPWSNGRVVMAGASYLGIAQWWAAIQDNPHLIGISPICSGDDEYLDRFYSTGGALQLGHRLLWFAENMTPSSQVRASFGSYIYHLPLRTSDVAATGTIIPGWRDALDHPSDGKFWQPLCIRDRLNRVTIPVLSFGGWFDNYAESDLDAFSRLSRSGKSVETWIGPWGHNPSLRFPTEDFGSQARFHIKSKQLVGFNHLVMASASAEVLDKRPAILHLFVMGVNNWRDEHEWPLARTQYRSLYLNSAGHANSRWGDGALEWHPPVNTRTDQFTYDPKRPVPTIGGAICCEPGVLPPGPLNQAPVEGRKDVLVYTSESLAEPIEVTGPVRTVLYVATSANDSDFTAKLVDVQPDGLPLLVTDGLQRLRYRLSLSSPVFVAKNKPYQITIDTGVTSYVFQRNHRIRLEVSSSNFPRFDRNLNTMQPNGTETRANKAHQTIFHEPIYPSAIILPVIPEPHQRRFEAHHGLQAAHRKWTSPER